MRGVARETGYRSVISLAAGRNSTGTMGHTSASVTKSHHGAALGARPYTPIYSKMETQSTRPIHNRTASERWKGTDGSSIHSEAVRPR